MIALDVSLRTLHKEIGLLLVPDFSLLSQATKEFFVLFYYGVVKLEETSFWKSQKMKAGMEPRIADLGKREFCMIFYFIEGVAQLLMVVFCFSGTTIKGACEIGKPVECLDLQALSLPELETEPMETEFCDVFGFGVLGISRYLGL